MGVRRARAGRRRHAGPAERPAFRDGRARVGCGRLEVAVLEDAVVERRLRPVDGRRQRPADDLVNGLDRCASCLQPVEERRQRGRGDRERVAARARTDVVHHDLDPAAAVLLGLEDVVLKVLHRVPRLDRVRRDHRVGRLRRNRLGPRAPVAAARAHDAAERARGVVATVLSDTLRGGGEVAERIGEVVRLEAGIQECDAVVTDLAQLLVVRESG